MFRLSQFSSTITMLALHRDIFSDSRRTSTHRKRGCFLAPLIEPVQMTVQKYEKRIRLCRQQYSSNQGGENKTQVLDTGSH